MSQNTIQQILDELENGIKPYSITIKPVVGGEPIIEFVFERQGNATYTLDFSLGRDITNRQDFLTEGLVNTSPVLLVKFDEDVHGAINQEKYLGCDLIYDTFEREQEHDDSETVAEFFEFAPEWINDTQQTAWHLSHHDSDDPRIYAFV